MVEKYRVHDLVKFNYSEIGEYIDENHTDRPLRNDIVVDLLNQLNDENEQLKKFKKQAYSIINNKINELAMTTSYGDVHNDLRVFAQRVLIDVKKEFDNPTYENCKVNVE